MEIEVALVNLKKLEFKRFDKIFIEKILRDYDPIQNKEVFSNKGLEVVGLKYKVQDEDKLVRYLINTLFEDYSIEKGSGLGYPDFLLKKRKRNNLLRN